jgi:hypothetical protein
MHIGNSPKHENAIWLSTPARSGMAGFEAKKRMISDGRTKESSNEDRDKKTGRSHEGPESFLNRSSNLVHGAYTAPITSFREDRALRQ